MLNFPNLDQHDTLKVINEALQIQLKLQKDRPADPLLARIYEEKGHVLRLLGGDASVSNKYNVQALQCMKSALALMLATKDENRKHILLENIDELETNKVVVAKLQDLGQFDSEFLS